MKKKSNLIQGNWIQKEENELQIVSFIWDDRINSGRFHKVTSSDGQIWEYWVADHNTKKSTRKWIKGGQFFETLLKAENHKLR